MNTRKAELAWRLFNLWIIFCSIIKSSYLLNCFRGFFFLLLRCGLIDANKTNRSWLQQFSLPFSEIFCSKCFVQIKHAKFHDFGSSGPKIITWMPESTITAKVAWIVRQRSVSLVMIFKKPRSESKKLLLPGIVPVFAQNVSQLMQWREFGQ